MASLRWKTRTSRGDLARISALVFMLSCISWMFSILVLRSIDLFIFFGLLTMEHMVISGIFAVTGDLYDFSGSSEGPKGWISSIYLESGPRERGP